MRIWTAQNISILDILKTEGIYKANLNHSNIYRGKGKQAYDLVIDRIKAAPIWGLHKYDNKKLSYNFLFSNYKSINQILPLDIFSKEQVLIELEKPNNEVLLTDFYKWVDILFYYQDATIEEKKDMEYAKKLDYCLDIRENEPVQAIFKDIRKEEILNIYYY